MKSIGINIYILDRVIFEKMQFIDVANHYFNINKNDLDSKEVVFNMCTNVLRNYNFLKYVVTSCIKCNFSFKEKLYIYIFLVNMYISKQYNDELYCEVLETVLNKELYNFVTTFDFDELFKTEYTGNKHLSFKYNLPESYFKMIHKQFSVEFINKQLQRLDKPFHRAYFLPELNEQETINFAKLYGDMFKLSKNKSFLYSSAKEKINLCNFKDVKIYEGNVGMRHLFDKVFNYRYFGDIALFSNDNKIIINELIDGRTYQSLNIMVPNIYEFGSAMNKVGKNQYKNVHLHSLLPYKFDLVLPTKQDLVIIMPESTNIDALKFESELLLGLDLQSLTNIILKQQEQLNDASEYVNNGGYLVYIVSTLNKKETIDNMKFFLDTTSDFELVEHKQMYFTDKYETMLYYAIFKRVSESNED